MYPYLKIIPSKGNRIRYAIDINKYMQQLNIYPLDISTVLYDQEVLKTIEYDHDNINNLSPCDVRHIFFRLIQEYEQEKFDGLYETVNTKYYDIHYNIKYYNTRRNTFNMWKFHDIIGNIRLVNVPPPHLIDKVYIRSVNYEELVATWDAHTKMYLFPNINLNIFDTLDTVQIIVKPKFSSNTLGYLAFNVLKEHIYVMFKGYKLSAEHKQYLCTKIYSSQALIFDDNYIKIFTYCGPYTMQYKQIYTLNYKNIDNYF